jgi:hypothetical protein
VTTALVAQVDAAVQGQPTDWAQFDAKVELWRALQDHFLSTLRSYTDVQPSRASSQGPPDVEMERRTHIHAVAETRRQHEPAADAVTWQADS